MTPTLRPRKRYDADAQTQETVQGAHPGRVAPGQVVVHRDHVHALPRQGVQIDRQRRHQGLPLARLHLGDLSLMQDHAADELDVEVPHPQRPAARLAAQREGIVQHVVELGAPRQAILQFEGPLADLLVGEGADRRLELVDREDARLQLAQLALVLGSDDLPEDGVDQHRAVGDDLRPRGGLNPGGANCGGIGSRDRRARRGPAGTREQSAQGPGRLTGTIAERNPKSKPAGRLERPCCRPWRSRHRASPSGRP